MIRTLQSAMTDIREGFRLRRVWIALAHEDIGDQHRRTALGPIWLLINYLAFAGTFVVIFGRANPTPNFSAYVAIGLFVWLYLSEVITQSVSLFSREESFIKGTTLPLTVYVMRMTMQSVIRAGYALAGCIAVILLVGTPVSVGWLSAAVALLLIVAATPAAITVFAMGGAFFPDLAFVVQNLMRLGMFLTPIFWVHTGHEGLRDLFYVWNPFTYFLEIVRGPVLSGEMPEHALAICLAITLLLWATASLLLGRLRKQIVFVI